MFTLTTELAIKALIYLGLHGNGKPVSPKLIAEKIDASSTYMAKITRVLVKADILKAHRGALGGVTLNQLTSKISLLDVLEACQGRVIGDYCHEVDDSVEYCAFHGAMKELHLSTVEVLSKWSLENLIGNPCPEVTQNDTVMCKMSELRKAQDASA